jgi:hypothetical protein
VAFSRPEKMVNQGMDPHHILAEGTRGEILQNRRSGKNVVVALFAVAAVGFCCAYVTDTPKSLQQADFEMLEAKVVLKNSSAASNCYDRTGACQTVNQFKSGPAEALEKKAKAKSKKLMRKSLEYLAKCKMTHSRAKRSKAKEVRLEVKVEHIRLKKMSWIYKYRQLRHKRMLLYGWYDQLKEQTEDGNEEWRKANKRYDKMEDTMDAEKFKYRRIYGRLYDLAREIDQDNKNDRDAGLLVDFNIAKKLLKNERGRLSKQVDDADLFEKRLEELKVTENDREAKKVRVRKILDRFNKNKKAIFAALREVCKRHKRAIVAWKSQKVKAHQLRVKKRHQCRMARRYKQNARRVMDSVKKSWPKLAQAPASATTTLAQEDSQIKM